VEQHAVAFTVAADRCVGGNRRYMGLVLGVINIFDNLNKLNYKKRMSKY